MRKLLLACLLSGSALVSTCNASVLVYIKYISQVNGSVFETGGNYSSGQEIIINVLPTIFGDAHRLSVVGVTVTNPNDVIGIITLAKTSATPITPTITIGIPSSLPGTPMTGLGWEGLRRTGNTNYTTTLAVGRVGGATTDMSITGAVSTDIVTQFAIDGSFSSTGSLVAGTAPTNCIIHAGAGIDRNNSTFSIDITSASGNLTIDTDSGGNINGNIRVGSTSSTALSGFQVNSLGQIGGDIVVTAGEIRSVTATGNIVNPAEFSSGQTWDSTHEPSLTVSAPTRLTISARDGIRRIRAPRVAAIINADSNTSGSGQIENLAVTGSAYSGTGATLYGTVVANQYYNPSYNSGDPTTAAIYVAGVQKSVVSYTGTGAVQSPFILARSAGNVTVGPVTAPITVTGDIDSGSTFQMKSLGVSGTPQSVSIGGNLAGNVKVEEASYGPLTVTGTISGQMVINANAGSSTGTDRWGSSFGSLSVNGNTISGIPYYASTSLGTGAVGLVPYHLHGEACFPPANSATPTPSPTVPLRYTFYGPLKAPAINPVFVSYRLTGSSDPWVNITSAFSYEMSGRSVLIHKNSSLWLEDGYDYQVEPNTSLLCDGLTTSADVQIYPSLYQFSVVGPIVIGCETGCE